MDSYTETLAQFPNLARVDFVGHSNGTYLLARALTDYPDLRVRKVVFAGSVVRSDFDWQTIFARRQVTSVSNYVASDDWVVALFPTFFEQRPWRWLFRNDVGSAGFNGFRDGNAPPVSQIDLPSTGTVDVRNVGFIRGSHGGFLKHIDSIVAFLLPSAGASAPVIGPGPRGSLFLAFVSRWLCWAVWLGLVGVIGWTGAHTVSAGGHWASVFTVAYILLVIIVLVSL